MRLLKIFIAFAWAILGLFVTAERAYAVFPGANGKIAFTGISPVLGSSIR